MADESQYSSDGFSSGPIPSASPDPVAAAVPPPSFYDSILPLTVAEQEALKIAARLNSEARLNSGVENDASYEYGEKGFSSYPSDGKQLSGTAPASKPVSHGTKKIDIPYKRVGVISGKRGEVLQILQLDSGAKIEIQVTVDLTGTPKQISKAEQLINDILKKAEEGGGQPQEGYQARPPSSWAPPGAPAEQVAGYGYMQPGPPQYGQSPYGSYPQQTSAGYSSTWEPPAYGQSQQSPSARGSYGAQSGYPQPAASGYGPPPTYGYGQAPPQAYGSYGSYPQAAPTCQAAYSCGYGAPPAYGQRLPRYGAPPAYSSGYEAPPPWLNQLDPQGIPES